MIQTITTHQPLTGVPSGLWVACPPPWQVSLPQEGEPDCHQWLAETTCKASRQAPRRQQQRLLRGTQQRQKLRTRVGY